MISKFKESYKKDPLNKRDILIFLVVVIFFGILILPKHFDLKKNGVLIKGKVVNCNRILINGNYEVKVEYTLPDGERKISDFTLYYDECIEGRSINLTYSPVTGNIKVRESNEGF